MSDPKPDPRLAALRKSISEMSDEELREVVKDTRNNRRTPLKPVVTKSLAQKRKSKAVSKVKKEVGKMTPEEALAMLAKIQRPSDA
jgi:hypothetical protein